MKSKVFSVNNEAMYDFRRSLKSALLPSIAVMLTLLYSSTYYSAAMISKYGENYNYAFLYEYFETNILYYFLLIIGAAAGITMFRFLASRQQINVLLSVGLTRTQLIKNRCIAFVSELLIAVVAPLTITLAVNIGAYGASAYILKVYTYFVISFFTVVLIGFAVAVLSSVFAGTVLESFALSAAFIAAPMAVLLFLNICCGFFLKGFYPVFESPGFLFPATEFFTFYDGFPFKLYFLNPLMLIFPSLGSISNSDWSNFALQYSDSKIEQNPWHFASQQPTASSFAVFIGWAIVSILILLIASRVFKKRRAEITGLYKSSKFTAATMGTVLMLYLAGMGLASGIFIARNRIGIDNATYLLMENSEKLQIFGRMLLYPLLGLIIFLLLYTFNVKRFLYCMKLSPLVLLTLVVPLICISGGLGYEKRLPDADNIEKIEVSYPHAPDYGIVCNNVSNDVSYFLNQNLNYDGFESPRDKEMVRSLHSDLIKGTDNLKSGYISVSYKLKDGSTLKRSYTEYSDETLLQAIKLFDSDTIENYIYKKLCDKESWVSFDRFREIRNKSTVGDTDITNIFIDAPQYHFENVDNVTLRDANSFYETEITFKLNDEKYDYLINCIAEDYRTMTAEEYYTPTNPCKYLLKVNYSYNCTDNESIETGGYMLFINASMKRTLSFLESLGVSAANAVNNDITEIALYECNKDSFYFQIYDPLYSTADTNGPEAVILEAENVKAVTPYAVYTNKNDIDAYAKKLNTCYLTVGQDVSYAAVTYSDGKQALFIVKK